jgi:DNA-binding response OmpR family regulator
LELVNDLLDLAKIEAGKIDVKPAPFDVANLFSALRGMLRPLLVSSTVNLVFEEPQGVPPMQTDEGKVSQILRNFISNAIKFTEQGEVRVTATPSEDGVAVVFSVADTGIGIAEADQARIFEEFSQIEHPLQRKVKGTGLGLPLCRKLAGLLGGSVEVASRSGEGAVFTATIPVAFAPIEEEPAPSGEASPADESLVPVLIVEDRPETRLLYEKYLRRTPFQPVPAGSIRQAREAVRTRRVGAVVLDILLPDESAWQWLAELKVQDTTKNIPVLIVSSVEDPRKGLALGADDYAVKPVQRAWLLERLSRLTGRTMDRRAVFSPVLVIDDEETDRYILRRHLEDSGCAVVEADSGAGGLRLAREAAPSLILLDLNMPGMDGYEVLARLRADERTAAIPVAVVTSLTPIPEAEGRLAHAQVVLGKSDLSPARLRPVLDAVRSRCTAEEAGAER